MKTSFNDLKMCDALTHALNKQGITSPTPIQALTYPTFLEGKNLIVESHTGSGKTLAFLLPLFAKIDINERTNQSIILAPTHELALQINEQAKLLAANSGIALRSALIMGEVNIETQIKKLKDKPQLIIGSAGRILDLMLKKKITANTITSIVLDEADNLLTHNQSGTVIKLLHQLNPTCQLTLFSASMGKHIESLNLPLLNEPVILRTSPQTQLNPLIEHYYIKGELREKFDLLKRLLQTTNTQKALVFVSQHTDTKVLVEKLNYHGFKVATISGKLGKEERKNALTAFKTGKAKILLSSDLSARGLDVPNITHIFHYDMPLTPEDYLHRAGRTARNGNKGASICILTPKDLGHIRILERDFKVNLCELKLIKGKLKNAATGEFLTPSETITVEEPPAKKSRNKYPKGFNQTKKETPKKSAPRKGKPVDETIADLPEYGGSLADALKLIADAGFDD